MRTPVAALLWESWRLTRVEMAFRMALAFVVGGAPLVVSRAVGSFGAGGPADMAKLVDAGAVVTLFLLAILATPFWFSIAMLNGGRLMDGGMPGFPFTIGYPRPVRTELLVGVPMTYFALAAAAAYVVPAVVLGVLFGYAFPLAPVAAWVVAFSLVQAATSWWTRSKAVQLVGSLVATAACVLLALRQIDREDFPGADFLPAHWPTQFAFSPADYGVIGAIALASAALAIASVARQRHGDTLVPVKLAGSAARSGWRVDVFRLTCPTATPAHAQWWFETKRTGAPLLTIAIGLAVAVPALLAAVDAWESAHIYALMLATFAPLVVLRMGIDNVFDLRRKPGLTSASTFDTSQAIGTTPLVALKVLVRTGCFLLAVAALGVSLWASVPLLNGWPAVQPWDYARLVRGQRAIAAAIDALTGPQRAALAVLVVTGVSAATAHVASLQVFRLLYPMRVHVGGLVLIVYTLTFLLWSSGRVTSGLASAIAQTYPWVIAAAISLSTIYVFRLALMERLLTAWHATSAVLLWTVCVASWLTLTQGGNLEVAARALASIALVLSLSLLPATAVALTPWSYGLVRHR